LQQSCAPGLADGYACPLRSTRKGEPGRPGGQFFKPLRQTIIDDTLKGSARPGTPPLQHPAEVLVRILRASWP
jgi:hypothetical protein